MRPLADRFWKKVAIAGPAECWCWTGGTVGRGYGTIRLGGVQRNVLAHRVSYELKNGPIPDGMQVLHRCDTPVCVNPAHLFLGTDADNMADRDAKGRGSKPPRHSGETHPRAKLTDHQVALVRTSHGTLREIATRFGMGLSQISAIRRGKSRNGHPTP